MTEDQACEFECLETSYLYGTKTTQCFVYNVGYHAALDFAQPTNSQYSKFVFTDGKLLRAERLTWPEETPFTRVESVQVCLHTYNGRWPDHLRIVCAFVSLSQPPWLSIIWLFCIRASELQQLLDKVVASTRGENTCWHDTMIYSIIRRQDN